MAPSVNLLFTFTDEGVFNALNKLWGTLKSFSRAAQEQESSLMQIGAALRATGKDAIISTEEIAAYAAELQQITKFGDEVTIASAKWFAQMPRLDPTHMREYMAAAQDMAEVMGTDLKTAAQVLSRALEDPRRASRALRRANIMLSTQQRRMLEIFDEAGMMAQAQQVIMDGVAASVAGAAEEMANTMEGVRGQIKGIYSDIKEHVGDVINQVLLPATRALKEEMEDWSESFGEANQAALKSREEFEKWFKEVDDGTLSVDEYEEALKKAGQSMTNTQKIGHGLAEVVRQTSNVMQNVNDILETMSEYFGILGENIDGARKKFFDWSKYAMQYMVPMIGTMERLREIGETVGPEAEVEQLMKTSAAQRERDKEAAEREKREPDLQEQADEADALMQKVKDEAREWARIEKEAEGWVRRRLESSVSAHARIMRDYHKINDLRERELATEAERLVIVRQLLKEYMEEYDFAKKIEDAKKEIAKTDKDMAKTRDEIAKIDKRIADEERDTGYEATITSLTGLYERMLAGAASRRAEQDPTVEELKKSREEAQARHKEQQLLRQRQTDALEALQTDAEAREEFAASTFK